MILGVGIDLIEHDRFARSIERFGDRAFPRAELGPHYAAHVDRRRPWRIHLSISHARGSSTAVAVWETLAAQP